jgi:plastocyanin
MYQWWVFVHLVGVFGTLASHGASIALAFRLRTERDPQRVESVLQLSGASIRAFYLSLGVLLVGGIAATFNGDLWGYGWIWASIITLIVLMVAMYVVARPYYHRVRFIAGAMRAGSTAVTPGEFDTLLRSGRGLATIAIGSVGLLTILFLMLFKPNLGFVPASTTAEGSWRADIAVIATDLSFSAETIRISSGRNLALALDNHSSVPHNISIYRDDEVLFVGDVFTGPRVVVYEVPPLEPGIYGFRCDVHPEQMTGMIEAR